MKLFHINAIVLLIGEFHDLFKFRRFHYIEYIYASLTFAVYLLSETSRSSHQRCSIKKGVVRNFSKFTGKHLCHSLFFNKETLKEKRLWHKIKETLAQAFSCEF